MASHVIVMAGDRAGYWGIGRNFHEAVDAAKWLRPGQRVFVVPCEATARVNELGTLFRECQDPVHTSVLRRVNGRNVEIQRMSLEETKERGLTY